MPMLLQRICRNSEQWTRPSGYPKDEGFPKLAGFGWDEWTFRMEDSFKGHVYTHTPYSPSLARMKELGPKFCVAFWTKDAETGLFLLVGFYRSAKWTTLAESDSFEAWMRRGAKKSVWNRRIDEVVEVTRLNRTQIESKFGPGEHCWRFACPATEVRPLKIPVQISPKLVGSHQRLSRPRIWHGGSELADIWPHCKPLGHSPSASLIKRKLGYTRSIREQSSAVNLAEEVLREQFVSFLSGDEQMYSDIRTEVRRIDVSFSIKGEPQIAELKSFKSAANHHGPLRNALGQLLSYNYGPRRSAASRWWIVVDEKPAKVQRKFLAVVASKHNLPLTIAYPNGKSFKVENIQ